MLSLSVDGSCQCGACAFRVDAQPYVCYTCHCRECQRLTSSAFTTCMHVPEEALEVTRGNPRMRARTADSGNELTTSFCAACGSALFARNSARPRMRTVFVGTLAEPDAVAVSAHIWTSRKLPWVELPAGHRQFAEGGDWSRDYAHDKDRYGV